MKQKELAEVVEDSLKTLNKLCYKIVEKFYADDIHDFRVEIKKLRAFLRLVNINKDHKDEPVIPKPLKTFYGHIGILRDIHLLKHQLSKYVKGHSPKTPGTYIKVLEKKENYRKKQIAGLIGNNNLDDIQQKIQKALPGELKQQRIKKFIQNKLSKLKELLEDTNDDTTMHNIRKILKDILYIWHYIKDHRDLPKIIRGKDELKSIAAILGDFMDKCSGLRFLQSSYLNKIKAGDEKLLLLSLRKTWNHEKLILKKKAGTGLNSLKQQLNQI